MKVIKLVDFISKYPAYRISAINLFTFINSLNEKDIIIDFCGVEGVTHSFAAQYQDEKKITNKNIQEININENVTKMFKILNNKKTFNDHNIEISNFSL